MPGKAGPNAKPGKAGPNAKPGRAGPIAGQIISSRARLFQPGREDFRG
jgi:hypothetical protein